MTEAAHAKPKAELAAKIINGVPTVLFTFDGDVPQDDIAQTVIANMVKMVGPYFTVIEDGVGRMVFNTCTARMLAYKKPGIQVVAIEFDSDPPKDSALSLALAGSVSKKTGN